MNDVNPQLNEMISKKDLDTILEVNKKTIEIHNEVAEQNEEIIKFLLSLKEEQKNHQKYQKEHDAKLNKIVDTQVEHSKEMFQLKVLFVSGLLTLVVQIIKIFMG